MNRLLAKVHGMSPFKIAVGLCCAMLAAPAWPSDVGAAASFLEGYREAEARRREARLQQLRLEEAERNAEIQKLEYERRMRLLQSASAPPPQSTGIRSIAQVAQDLSRRAPFVVDGRAVLKGASSPYEGSLFLYLQFPDHNSGSALSDDQRLATEAGYLVGLACQEASIRSSMIGSATAVIFNLFDGSGRFFATKHVRGSDCQ